MKKSKQVRAYEVAAALVAADAVFVPRAELRWIASETNRVLDGLARDVRENKNVMLASLYARWVQFSGVLAILERESNSNALTKKVDDLLYECGELFRGGKHDPRYAVSDIAEINRKLDLLLLLEDTNKLSPGLVDAVGYFGFQIVDADELSRRKLIGDKS
jgi:hypothetical protein